MCSQGLFTELVPCIDCCGIHANEHCRRRSAQSSEPRVGVLAMDDCDIDPWKGRSRVAHPRVSWQATMDSSLPVPVIMDLPAEQTCLLPRPLLTATGSPRPCSSGPRDTYLLSRGYSPPATFCCRLVQPSSWRREKDVRRLWRIVSGMSILDVHTVPGQPEHGKPQIVDLRDDPDMKQSPRAGSPRLQSRLERRHAPGRLV